MKNADLELTYQQGLERAKEYGLEAEYRACIIAGLTPQEACFGLDI